MGVDVGGTKLLLVALRRGERLVETRRVPTSPWTGPDLVEREVRSFLASLTDPPVALGVAVAGIVDDDGTVADCGTFPRLEGWRAADAFADLGCPVSALNDADAALAEEAHGLAPGATAAIVMAGTWIGAAVRANDRSLRGAMGWAGELGFAPIAVEEGRVVRLDDLAAGEAGEAMGLGLAGLVNLLNPDLLALGGGAFALPGYREAALETAERWSLSDPWKACLVRPVRAGEAVAALGAARVARRTFST